MTSTIAVCFNVLLCVLQFCTDRTINAVLYSQRIFYDRNITMCFRAFSLDDLDDYEKHFTVMNYKKGVQLKQVK